MSKLAIILTLVLILLSLSTGYFAFAFYDSLVSLDHSRRRQQWDENELAILRSLVLLSGTKIDKSTWKSIINQKFDKTHVVKAEGTNELAVDSVVLKFRGPVLIDVHRLE